jgi:2-dehydro-3-deoxyphosphogluconate aldolase/(4S)-4-hydroxy-2-oxoglutarate aldolase
MPAQLPELLPQPTVIPVVTVHQEEDAVAVAAALHGGGLATIEITLRTPGAWAAAAAVRERCPQLLLGIGTVTRAEQLERAVAMGAGFAVSPGFSSRLATAAREMNIAYLPGIASPGELMQAVELGYSAVKVFPVARLGGPGILRQYSELFPELGFSPSGGIEAASLADYLAIPAVFAVGGSWLAPAAAIAARDWAGIEARAREAAQVCAGRGAE